MYLFVSMQVYSVAGWTMICQSLWRLENVGSKLDSYILVSEPNRIQGTVVGRVESWPLSENRDRFLQSELGKQSQACVEKSGLWSDCQRSSDWKKASRKSRTNLSGLSGRSATDGSSNRIKKMVDWLLLFVIVISCGRDRDCLTGWPFWNLWLVESQDG